MTPEDVRLFDIAGGPTARERGTTKRVWKARQGDLFGVAVPTYDGPAVELRDCLRPLAEDVQLPEPEPEPTERRWLVNVSLFNARVGGPRAPEYSTVHHLRLGLADRLPDGFSLRPARELRPGTRPGYHLLQFDIVAPARCPRSTVQDIAHELVDSVACLAVCYCHHGEPWVIAQGENGWTDPTDTNPTEEVDQ